PPPGRIEGEPVLWTMLANLAARFPQWARGFSFGKLSRDTGVSNPPPSLRIQRFSAVRRKSAHARETKPGDLDGCWGAPFYCKTKASLRTSRMRCSAIP